MNKKYACPLCNGKSGSKSSTEFNGHYICHECIKDMYPIYRRHLEVDRIIKITDKIEFMVDQARDKPHVLVGNVNKNE